MRFSVKVYSFPGYVTVAVLIPDALVFASSTVSNIAAF